jgi:protein-S-isoprenylcysteine O-methyltransferase Ste14
MRAAQGEAAPGDGTPAPRPAITWAGLRVAGANAGLALYFLAFAAVHVRAFAARPRASLALVVTLELVIAVLAAVRRDATATSTTPWAWVTTLLGTFGPLLLRPVAGADDLPVAVALQLCGTSGAILGAVALSRSFGLLPACRGIRTGGAYRVVRHPLYAAYFVANLGYLLNHPSGWNVGVLAVATAAQVARIRNEERLLSADPEYVAYRRRTRWRLVPFVY